jgi:hypothetical protein
MIEGMQGISTCSDLVALQKIKLDTLQITLAEF